jgi:hypothetical protein
MTSEERQGFNRDDGAAGAPPWQPTPYDDLWINACTALIANTPPDPKPLAALLRSRKQIPEETIRLLANLLDPPLSSNPSFDPLGCRLELVPARDIADDFMKHVPIVNEYEKQYDAEEIAAHESAKERTAEKFNIGDSAVDRARRWVNNLKNYLNGDA